MKNAIKNTAKRVFASALLIGMCAGMAAYADNVGNLTLSISNGTRAVNLVNGNGLNQTTTDIAMTSTNYSFAGQTSTGTLGDDTPVAATDDQIIHVSNPTNTDWTLTFDLNGSTNWEDGLLTMPANGTTSTGLLAVDPSSAVILDSIGGSASAGITGASASDYNGGSAVTLVTATGANAQYDEFFITGVGLTQNIPAEQEVGNYTINMTLTFT